MDSINVKDAFGVMRGGGHVVVICKSRYEAGEAARGFYEGFAGRMGFSRSGNVVSGDFRKGYGSVEFGWVETRSGRRLDDFADARFGIEDGFSRRQWPADRVDEA
ncbi:hypothetical protein [Limimaricola cinnabarinus]|uniref:hypothetical protein n=1 Tax=Limimaricola cinnabarinus TaxID=1125964 RepID=UPI0024921736|nr:hypothetical protein [Limimaricola cinnabarinus]